MFGETKPAVGNNLNQARYPDAPTPPKEYGVSSAMESLLAVVNESAGLGEELRSALGISIPKDQPTQSAGPSSVVNALSWAASALRNANADVTDCIRHLRS